MKISHTGKEKKLDPTKYMLSVTDTKGNIVRVNDYFVEICSYTKDELIGSPHNIVRHPDMPRAIFYLMWKYIKNGQNITAVVKNKTKDGGYYWFIADIEVRRDEQGNIDRYIAFRQAAPKKIVKIIDPLYKELLKIERRDGMQAAVRYFLDYISKEGGDYSKYIEKLKKRNRITLFFMEKIKKYL